MNILMLFPYAPLPPPLDLAGTKRNLPFLIELAKVNNVSVLSFGTEVQRQQFLSRFGKLVSTVRFVDAHPSRWVRAIEQLWLMATFRSPYRQLYRSQMQAALDDMVSSQRPDLIHCCVPMFGYYRFPACIPVTSDTHEVKFDLLRRTAQHEKRTLSKVFNYWCSRLGQVEEPKLWKKFDAVIATTDVDARRMMAVEPSLKPLVVENGAGNEFFRRSETESEPRTMVFTGLFTHPPNIQGIEYFLDKVFPLILNKIPDAKIYVVGKSPPMRLVRRANQQIVVTGFVEDVRPYLERAEIFVIPLLAGGGIRGKALEAMAMSKPIVTTTLGVEGIRLRNRESALFADDPQTFADRVIELFQNPSLRSALARKAFEIASQGYAWAQKGEQLNRVIRSVAAARHSNTGVPSQSSSHVSIL